MEREETRINPVAIELEKSYILILGLGQGKFKMLSQKEGIFNIVIPESHSGSDFPC